MNALKQFPPKVLPIWIATILAVCCCTVIPVALAQAPATPAARQETPAARLEITGAVKTPLSLSAADLKAMQRTTVRIGGQTGQVYEGVALSELLQRAGVPQGGDLSGPWMAAYVLATAGDGYRATFSLSELDAGIGGVEVLVADTLDGAPLGQGQGPFRLVVPSDKRAARWVRMLKSITIAGM